MKALIQPGDAPVHEWQHNKGALEHEADAPLSGRLDSFLKQIAVELVPELGMWPTLGAKGDLKLLAEEQVLDDEAPTATEGGDESDPYGAGRVEHRCEIADQLSADRRAAFCPFQPTLAAFSAIASSSMPSSETNTTRRVSPGSQ